MNEKEKGGRLLSLDALRGLDMLFLVGLSGIFRTLPELGDNGLFRWLSEQTRHPDWHGFTAYDVVFPLFIFIVGVAIPVSFSRRLDREGKPLMKHVFMRFLTLTILGVMLWQVPGGAHPTYGFYSVLYRIGFSYFFASLIFLRTSIHGQIYWTFGILLGYWIVMRFVSPGGYAAGDFSEEGSLATHIHNWTGKILSPDLSYVLSPTLLTSISNALMGVLAGQWLMSDAEGNTKARNLVGAGIGLMLVAGLSHLDFPTNKKLASPSFTLLACGISSILLGFFYWIIDVKKYKRWAFILIVVGVNPITIYVADFLVDFRKLANVFVGELGLGNATSLFTEITSTVIIWLFLFYLFRQKVFFKI